MAALAVLPAADDGIVSLDRAMVSWGLLAILLALGCIVVFQEWRHGRLYGKRQTHLETLFRLSESILGASDREELLERAAAAAVRVGEMSHAFILLVDQTGRQLIYSGGTEALPRTPISIGSISGAVACFRSRETTEAPDAESCPFSTRTSCGGAGEVRLYRPSSWVTAALGVVEVEERTRRRGIHPGAARARLEHVARLTRGGPAHVGSARDDRTAAPL
ncbi:MAG: hypothetical protein R2748_09560 [Bryobacterales bacterium]